MFSHKNFNSTDSFYTRHNVSLQIVLIAFLAYTKRPKNIIFKNTMFDSRYTVILPQLWQLLGNM